MPKDTFLAHFTTLPLQWADTHPHTPVENTASHKSSLFDGPPYIQTARLGNDTVKSESFGTLVYANRFPFPSRINLFSAWRSFEHTTSSLCGHLGCDLICHMGAQLPGTATPVPPEWINLPSPCGLFLWQQNATTSGRELSSRSTATDNYLVCKCG